MDQKINPTIPPPQRSSFRDRIDFPSLLKQIPRTFLALLCTLSLSVFMTAMQAVADNRAISANLHKQASEPLPDILMDWASAAIPLQLADILLNSLIFFSLLIFALSWRWRVKNYGPAEGHYRTLRIARKFLWMLATAYLLRSFSLLSTTMPPSDPRCTYKQRKWHQIPFMGFEIMSKQGNTCSDKVFSGHSSMATLLGLFWLGALLRPNSSKINNNIDTNNNSNESHKVSIPLWRKLASIFIVTWVISIYIFCVLCRNHYSIDIVVAIFVCTGIFSIYQLSIRVIELLLLKVATESSNNINNSNNSTNNKLTDQDIFKSLSTSTLSFSPFKWNNTNNNHLINTTPVYSPIDRDPETALAIDKSPSPQIIMQDIQAQTLQSAETVTEDVSIKPPTLFASNHHLNIKDSKFSASYTPRAFIIFLRAIAWMDGFDLKP